VIRRATVADADGVADVFVPSFAGLTFLPKLHTDEETRRWIRSVVLEEWEVWVAETSGGIVGFAALSDDTLQLLYVHPKAQGRRHGARLLAKAKERRPEGFGLWVFQQNEGARRFYDRHGFRLVELTDGSHNEEGEPDARYEWRP
jgi:GNAT superfamily N-acetyltransferase